MPEKPRRETEPRPATEAGKTQERPFGVAAPQLSLPKGGGAIRGIGEKFAANPVTGTGSLSVPIYASPGRSGFGPQLSLTYDSGSGNGPFGFGWSLALPRVTRKTDKGLPQYEDYRESDTFILSGAEDLVPSLTNKGSWQREVSPPRTVNTQQYQIHYYLPRVEGLFARIERWVNVVDPQDTFWRSISRDNITTWYGKTPGSRVADPADPTRIFTWLICESYDDKGNVVVYSYKPEDSAGVDLSQANERNRSDRSRSAQLYIQSILYGNRTPYFPDLTINPPFALPTDWCFQLVFDYGEHDLHNPVPVEPGSPAWIPRPDPFSTYRATFEVRTYRLCRRVLMFHHFDKEIDVGLNCLVRSTDLAYSTPPSDPSQPFYSFLSSVKVTGYTRTSPSTYTWKSLPSLDFEYTQAKINETVRVIDSQSLENISTGVDGARYRWVDLDGEGLSGVLTEQAGAWFYKPNLSPVNQQTVDGVEVTLPQFGPVQIVMRQPSLASLSSGRQQLMDLSGDGKLDLVDFHGPSSGFFERTDDADWEPFQSFRSLPVLDWNNPNLKFIDLNGDGFPDVLISEDQAFWWHESLSTEGFGPGQRVAQALDEEKGPRLVFADGAESVFLADTSGDGLTDLVRIRNGEVCYWPNEGYGRFGAKVTMDESPQFDRSELFDGRRVRLADIDGSGTADIIYFAAREVHLYFNQSGNAWGTRRALTHFPSVESVSTATPIDLLGNGTVCLVWSSTLPGSGRRSMRYVDLMGGQKPHLLVRATNNLGSDTVIQYAPSTKFYVADKLAETPWLTRLPFPVQVVEQVETYDYISRNRFVSRYSYHHGFYDGVEREFRGFGRVDQWDTEELATLSQSSDFPQSTNKDPSSVMPPIWTRTWFHTGAFFGESVVSKHMKQEYYLQGQDSFLNDTVLPMDILLPDETRIPYDLSGEEMREACRALRGSVLRQEIYALDGSDASARPYTVSEHNYTIEALQPQGPNQFGVFFSHSRETIDLHYDRNLYEVVGGVLVDPSNPPPGAVQGVDPRVSHSLTLAVDRFGNVLQSVAIGYGRKYTDPALTPADQSRQTTTLSAYSENSYTNPVDSPDSYRTRLPAQTSSYELIGLGLSGIFAFKDVQAAVKTASDGAHDIPYEDLTPPSGLKVGPPYRRLLMRMRTKYRPNDMGANAGTGPDTLLDVGVLESLALPGSSYKLAFTPGLISQVYQRGGTALLATPANVLGTQGVDGGGYVDLDGDGNWWAPSGRIYHLPTVGTSAQETTEALQHFYLPRRFQDPFGNSTSVTYDDPHDLLVVQTVDALTNPVAASNDYRVLAPYLLTDPNGNRASASFDALGMVAGTAVMGKTTERLGDHLINFNPDLSQAQIDSFYNAADPHDPNVALGLLGDATTRIIYNLQQFTESSGPNWQPVWAATIAREIHLNDPGGQQSPVQVTFTYSDGFGREIQKKGQAEPGPVVAGGPTVTPRWVGSGWTVFNNKGKPVRQYEPFFSQLAKGHQFEFGTQVGVSPVLGYDPVERVVVTLHPNQTYEKIVVDPWRQYFWDVNDAVLQLDPATDPDVGDFFALLPRADYFPTWYTQSTNAGGQAGIAATKAAAHANTPTTAYFDALGRAFLTVLDNGGGNKFPSRLELDIQGNQRAVHDAIVQAGDVQGRIVMLYDYDMLQNRIHQASMEAGERWMLNDAAGKAIRAWDRRGHNFRTEYDVLRRPTGQFVTGTDVVNSDPRTLAGELAYEKIIYGEGQTSPELLNLRTRVYQHLDAAGVVTNTGHNSVTNQDEGFDFKGNLLRSGRGYFADYKALPNLSAPPPTPDVFTSSTQYDALNRPTAMTTNEGTIVHPAYNEANLLKSVNVNLRGAAALTPYVSNIDYNAKGQRTAIVFGNANTESDYTYDPLTFRLVTLTTTRQSAPANQQVVQALTYTYDPIGNITHIQDDADIQNVVFFQNRRVEPSADYTYDPLYRLIQASGREQLGLNGGAPLPPVPTSYNDVPRIQLPHPGDGNAMGTYSETYVYDPVGNVKSLTHQGSNPSNRGWARSYTYIEASLLEPAKKTSNRVSSTALTGSQTLSEPYTYDLHGNMTSMPQLQVMQWDFKDQLYMTQRQAVNANDQDGQKHQGERTYYVYDAAGQRVRKATESSGGTRLKETFYLGSFQLYREYDANAKPTLARETLHVMDDKKRVALVETTTIGTNVSTIQRFQFDNHLGTACLELDETAAVITYEEYYPYGGTSYQAGRTKAETSLKRYRYIGKERDEETGLNYHGARYYATWLGRWTSCDPAGTVDGLNVYQHTRGNPVRFTDKSGARIDFEVEPKEPQEPPKAKLSPAHQKIKSQAHEHRGEDVEVFGFGESFKWGSDPLLFRKTSPYLHQYKAQFVHSMRDPIEAAAKNFDLPPELIAGVAYAEVGGKDALKPFVYGGRALLQTDPDKTSLGPMALQVRSAAEALGYNPKTLTPEQRNAVIESLNNPSEAVFIAAKRLSDMRRLEFRGKSAKDLDTSAIEVIGSRYNQGPVPLSNLQKDLSYGKTINRRWEQLSGLLTETPVAKPEWSPIESNIKNPLMNAMEDASRKVETLLRYLTQGPDPFAGGP